VEGTDDESEAKEGEETVRVKATKQNVQFEN
jgi:hypothetical protein